MMKIGLTAAILLFATSAMGQCLLTTETESLPAFFVGEQANFQIVAVSGTPPYKFEVDTSQEGSNPLPANLHLTPSGRIIGKPQQEGSTVVFIKITDAAGCELTHAYNVDVFTR